MKFHQLIEKLVDPSLQTMVEQIIAKANLNPSSAKLEEFVTQLIDEKIENTESDSHNKDILEDQNQKNITEKEAHTNEEESTPEEETP